MPSTHPTSPTPPLAALRAHPNALAHHYSAFRVGERTLLSGHSHQAWPDVARLAQDQAFLDAAEHVDEKWERAFAKAEEVRRGWARLLDDPDGDYALAESTHTLLVRFLSGLPLRDRPRIVITDGEFHTVRRQLARLEEEGLEVVRVPALPETEVGERLAEAVDDRTAAIIVSAVFFETARIAGGLGHAAAASRRRGVPFLVDAYHALNVMPFPLRGLGLEDAWVLGGGYKYCQLGEANCCLRIPPGASMRPAVTGWFADFEGLTAGTREVRYGAGGQAFAGATYDPVSHYRAAEVFAFFERLALTPERLREISQHQIGLLIRSFDALDLPSSRLRRDREAPLGELGGFLALRSSKAGEVRDALRRREIFTDHRGDILRLGPAPYLSDRQIEEAGAALGEIVGELWA